MKPNESGVQFVGADKAMDDLVRWAAELGPAVVAGSASFASSLADQVQGQVPVLTGTLAASVEIVEDSDGFGITYTDDPGKVGWIEFGGSRGRDLVSEGRYLFPTALDAEDKFQQLAADIADDTVRRFPWSTPSK